MKEKPFFIYYFKDSGWAIAHESRDDTGTGLLLFTCPESWLPQNQTEFEAAARFYGIQHPQKMKYDPDCVPF